MKAPKPDAEHTLLGPILCQRCKARVRWVRRDGELLLVNDRGRRPHVCRA
jgi:hypothetical protein